MQLDLPKGPRFALLGATLPSVLAPESLTSEKHGLCTADLVVSDGRIEAVLTPGTAPSDMESMDLEDRMVWPCFVDMHTHIDKGHIWDRQPNPTGDFEGALTAVRADTKANWHAKDVETRMDFSLRCAYAHGTNLLRTHIDSLAPQHRISFEVFSDVRARWSDRIKLQAVALFPIDAIDDDAYFTDLVNVVADHGALLGGVTYPMPDLDSRLDRLFQAAADKGLDVDLHVDETQDASVLTLAQITEAKQRNGFEGAVTVGHCCSLAQQDEYTAKATIEKVNRTGLSVVSLPMCNMYLQDRQTSQTPRSRGITLLHELMEADIPVAVASDNTRDPFYAYGDLDMVEVFREAVRIAHLDHPLDDAAELVTRVPADILNEPEFGRIAKGCVADLVIFNARTWSEFLSRPQADRIVMRNGMGIDRRLPDYRELDPLMRG